MAITHSFVSSVPDGADETLVQPSDWNATHTGYPVFSGAVLTKSASQIITTGSETPVSFDGEVFDTDNYHDNSTNNTRLTSASAGYYMVGGSVELIDLSDQKYMILTIRKSGSSANGDGRSRIQVSMSSATPIATHISRVLSMGAGDYVELVISHNKGSDANARDSTAGTSFWIYKVG